jgi:hypothetical protein
MAFCAAPRASSDRPDSMAYTTKRCLRAVPGQGRNPQR